MIIEGNIVDVINKRIYSGYITVNNGVISEIVEEENSVSQYIIPGFVDAHVHVESSMLIPSEFARLAVCHGTVATISDPHEIGNVLGVEGVKFMIENGKKTPFKFHFGAPSCVPATVFETAGANITVVKTSGLTGSDYVAAGPSSMIVAGTGLEDDMSTVQFFFDKGQDVVKFIAKWRLGVAVSQVDQFGTNGLA